jgi:CheY-like chemotaxis protein
MRTQAYLTVAGRSPKGYRKETRRLDVMKGTSGEMGSNQPDFLPSSDETPLVLIIEDEQPIAEALRYIVEDRGYQTIMGRDGLEGLEMVRQRHPDLIITDLMMPRLDGLTFIRAVREDAARAGRRAPPVILTSAIENVSATDSNVPDAFVPKPFDLDYLEHLLDQYLAVHH